MANETIETSSFANQKAADEECCENVPPALVSGVTGPTTPTLTCNDKAKPRLSGLQSALSPILKYLNIGNKRPPPLPSFSCNNGPAKPNSTSILSLVDKDNQACSMLNENLPEITLLDVTCDSTVNITRNIQCDSAPSSPVITKEWKNPLQVLDVNLNSKLSPSLTPIHWLHDEILPEMTLLDDTCDATLLLIRQGLRSDSVLDTPISKADMPNKHAEKCVEINSKENLTQIPKIDTSNSMSEKETPTFEISDDYLPKNRTLETSEIMFAKTSKLEIRQCSPDKMSTTYTGNLTHSISSASGISDSIVEDVKRVKLQVTQDISMGSTIEISESSSESSTQKMDKSQPAAEPHPVNITCELSASNTSVQREECQYSKNDTSELQVEPVKASPREEPSSISDKTEWNNQNKALNNTFCTVQGPSDAATHTSVLQNRTLDIPTSNGCRSFTTKNEITNVSTKQVSPESSQIFNGNCSGSKSSQSSAMQNQIFEKDSLQKSNENMEILVEVGPKMTSLQNTFENKPNGTITCTENTAMGDEPQVTPEKSSPSPVKNVSTTEPNLPKILGEKVQATMDSNVKLTEPRESTFNINTPVEENSGSSGGSGEAKDSLNNGHPLCESIVDHSTFTESHKANTFNLDNTLDFRPDPLVTSTPMPTNKAFNFSVEREFKTAAAQKKLYGDRSSKPMVQVAAEVPSNIVCDQKTFLCQPATKQNLLPMKPPSLLSKFKPGSMLSKRHDLPTTGLPVKTNTAQILQQTTKMTSSYNLRSTTAAASALKQPVSGLRKPAVSSIPSGNQRPGHSLKPPQAKSTSSVASAFDKPIGGTNPAAKTTLPAKRHHLPRTDPLPAAKKKKIDTPLPSSNVEASVASSDTAKAKSLKPPSHSQKTLPAKPFKNDVAVPSSDATATSVLNPSRVRTLRSPVTSLKTHMTKPQYHGCATCSLLEEQLKWKDEEIKQLKEELLKWSKTEDPAS